VLWTGRHRRASVETGHGRKGVLFKRFADIDVFDIELGEADPDKLVEAVKMMEPTFGGVNLEDIKAPECFTVEERLREEIDIPVFHDDQHGTAIISGAALINAADVAGEVARGTRDRILGSRCKTPIATARFYVSLGCRKENITM